MPLALAIILLVIVAVIIGAAGMFVALSSPVQDDPDSLTDADPRPASLLRGRK